MPRSTCSLPRCWRPIKIKSPRIEQFRRPVQLPNGTFALAEQPEIRAEPAIMTGSRFPDPGYKITSRSIDLTRYSRPLTNPNTGKEVKRPRTNPDCDARKSIVWRVDARQNFYFAGPVPVFYWPHIVQDLDDLEPPLRMIGFNTNNYFGQQLKTDWNGFRLHRAAPAQVDRHLEHRRRLPECPDQGFPGARKRDGLVRHRSDPRPERSVPRGSQSAGSHHQELLRVFRHLGPARMRASTFSAPGRRS